MSLYIPARNRIDDESKAFELIHSHGFATLITPGDADCFVSHLPLVLDTEQRSLLGHMAVANDHHRHLENRPSIAVFHGPHAYMSAGWYPAPTVPTWNYAVCHVSGQARLVTEPALRLQLEMLTNQYEATRDNRWHAVASETDRRIHRIVGFAMPIEKLETKFKLDQQYDDAVIEQLAAFLEADDRGITPDLGLARMMRDRR